jgi:hypothetical protein
MHKVKCKCCNQIFDRDTIPCVKEGNRYSHKECYEKRTAAEQKEENDKTALDKYIITLFKLDYVTPRIQKQIKQYVEEYHYSYSGIHKALVYFYEVKGNSIDKSNNGIGIVPYIYKDAYNYYYSIWEANQKNKEKSVEDFKIQQYTVHIKSPERPTRKKRKLFSFLDKE